jgi:pSer/pThr/pTyr-binding forkhead associated (FHA) protein
LTITVDEVADGNAYNIGARSGLTIEDLKTKIGTFVNGTNIKGSKHKLQEDSAELTIGKFASKFRYA